MADLGRPATGPLKAFPSNIDPRSVMQVISDSANSLVVLDDQGRQVTVESQNPGELLAFKQQINSRAFQPQGDQLQADPGIEGQPIQKAAEQFPGSAQVDIPTAQKQVEKLSTVEDFAQPILKRALEQAQTGDAPTGRELVEVVERLQRVADPTLFRPDRTPEAFQSDIIRALGRGDAPPSAQASPAFAAGERRQPFDIGRLAAGERRAESAQELRRRESDRAFADANLQAKESLARFKTSVELQLAQLQQAGAASQSNLQFKKEVAKVDAAFKLHEELRNRILELQTQAADAKTKQKEALTRKIKLIKRQLDRSILENTQRLRGF